jgi:hypothetical protein
VRNERTVREVGSEQQRGRTVWDCARSALHTLRARFRRSRHPAAPFALLYAKICVGHAELPRIPHGARGSGLALRQCGAAAVPAQAKDARGQ